MQRQPSGDPHRPSRFDRKLSVSDVLSNAPPDARRLQRRPALHVSARVDDGAPLRAARRPGRCDRGRDPRAARSPHGQRRGDDGAGGQARQANDRRAERRWLGLELASRAMPRATSDGRSLAEAYGWTVVLAPRPRTSSVKSPIGNGRPRLGGARGKLKPSASRLRSEPSST